MGDRMTEIAMVCGRKILHVPSVYAPQQSMPEEEKRKFLEKLSDNTLCPSGGSYDVCS